MNISPSGLYIKTDSPFSVSRLLSQKFAHPFNMTQVKVDGRIVRTDNKEIGFKYNQPLDGIL